MPAGPTDRTHIVIAILAELIHDRAVSQDAEDAPYMTASDAARLDALATGLSLAVDHGAVADTWRVPGTEDATADWIANIITGKTDREEVSADTRREEVAVARRLADVAASLRVRGETFEREAAALWDAASRLLGFEVKPAEVEPPPDWVTIRSDIHNVRRERDAALADAARLREDHDRECVGRDTARKQLSEALRERNEARHRAKFLDDELGRLERRAVATEAEFAEVRRERDDLRAAMRVDAARHVAEVERIKGEWAASDQHLVAAHALEIRALTEQLAAARAANVDTSDSLENLAEAVKDATPWWQARVVGDVLKFTSPSGNVEMVKREHLTVMSEANKRLGDQVADLTRQLASARSAWVPPPPGMPMPHHRPLEIPVEGREVLRQTIARLGVRSVALYWGPAPGDLSIVVDLCDGKPTLDEIADALEASHDLKRGTYRLREVKAPPVR